MPQALSEVVLKAMAKDRNARYQTADEMMEAITKGQPAEGQKPAAGVARPLGARERGLCADCYGQQNEP